MNNMTALLASDLSTVFETIRRFFAGRVTGNLLFVPTAAVGEGWYPYRGRGCTAIPRYGFQSHDVRCLGGRRG
jgi:hypothetical protein